MPRQLETILAEESIAQINSAIGLYNKIAASQTQLRLHRFEARAPATHLFVPRIISIGEDFCRNLLLIASAKAIDTSHPLRLDLWSTAESRAESSWNSIKECWKIWHGVALGTAPSFATFRAFVDARNSIMHGVGKLTRKQVRNPNGRAQLVARLASVGISVDLDDRLILSSDCVVASCKAAIELIRWLDEAALTKGVVSHSDFF
jgi:hypothetical protein